VQTTGNLQLKAGSDITTRASTVDAGGQVAAIAGNKIHILASSANPANVATAVTAAAIETENNALSLRGSARLMNTLRRCEGSNAACNIEDLKQEMKRDTDKQSERIAAACTGATADLANCMQLSNNANTVALNLLNSTNYSDSPEKKAMLMQLINQQLADMDALNKLVEGNVANASFNEAIGAYLAGAAQALTMAGVRVKDKDKGNQKTEFQLSKAEQFEKGLVHLPPGERVAVVKQTSKNLATQNGWEKDARLSALNSRDVYKSPDGYLYSLDTQHGAWEKSILEQAHMKDNFV
jgi:hypothetical protein